MERHGFIHDMMDVKVLILFVASRANYPMTTQQIYELCYQDDCLSYFDVCTAVPEMVASGHLQQDGEQYTITEKGREDGKLTEDSVAFSVRQRAENAVTRFNRQLRRKSYVSAGYTKREENLYYRGRPVTLELLVDADNSFRTATADFLAEELEKLGIAVTVSRLSWSEFTARLTAGTFDLYLAETLMTADFDPESLIGSTGSLNFGKWNDPETDTLLSALRSGESGARRQLYDLLSRQSPIAPICFKNHTALTQWGRMEGLTPTRADSFAGESWRLAAE